MTMYQIGMATNLSNENLLSMGIEYMICWGVDEFPLVWFIFKVFVFYLSLLTKYFFYLCNCDHNNNYEEYVVGWGGVFIEIL